ncbi:MAG TPA: amidoligase family protein [Polyangia bacterium]|nr:amidoligase family protein [Polyangia bacterium]
MTEPIPITELTFGVEFEVILPRDNNGERGRDAIAAAFNAAGLPARHDPLTHRAVPYWRITTDSTIGYENAEIVSPSREILMRGEAGFETLRKAAKVISDFGCSVDRRCGTHVHVGVRDSDYEQLGSQARFERLGFFKELLKTYSKFEPVFDSLMARSRRESNNPMCRPITFPRDAENATTIDGLLRVYGLSRSGNDRHYSKLNLGAYIRHGTVEFRQHQGTTNTQKIENWVKLCLRMVAHAARNTERAGSSGEFVPPAAPLRPTPPRFPDRERDLASGRRLLSSDLPRFARSNSYDLRDMVVVSVTPNGHRPGSRTYDRLEACRHPGQDLYTIWRTFPSVQSSWLGYFADRGELLIVRRSTAPTVATTPEEGARREAAMAEWRETVRRMEVEHNTSVERARREWEAARGSTPVVSRPPTDSAPATLEGLLSLVSAVESERAYFTERQMELN